MPPESLQLIADCIECAFRSKSFLPDDRLRVVKCLEQARSVVGQWSKLFKIEAMTKDSLDLVCLGGDVESWRKVAEITKVDLPSIDEIQVKLQDFWTLENCATKILLAVDEDSSFALQRIFKGYNCMCVPGTPMYRLLMGYDSYSMSGERSATEISSLFESKELRHLREECLSGMTFRDQNTGRIAHLWLLLKAPIRSFS